MGSFLLNYDELFADLTNGGFNRVSREGTELGSPTRGFVEDKVTLNTTWTHGRLVRAAVVPLPQLADRAVRGHVVGLRPRRPISAMARSSRYAGSAGRAVDIRKPTARQPVLHGPAGRLGSRQDLFGGGWSFAVGVQNLTDEIAADLLLLRPEQPRRDDLSHRGPVLVPAGVIPELTAASPIGRRKAPARGLFFGRSRARRVGGAFTGHIMVATAAPAG